MPDGTLAEVSPFASLFFGGFESSTHLQRTNHERRLDLIASTHHDRFVEADYRLLQAHGMGVARDALRWHLCEPSPGRFDWSSWLPMLRAQAATGQQVIWDLVHYGYPPDADPFAADWPVRVARFAREAARVFASETDAIPFWTPINEISFWAWGGGDVRALPPFCERRGGELKRQLARATIAAVDAVRSVDPRARICCAEPLINVLPKSDAPADVRKAAAYVEIQFESMDLVSGRIETELGGRAEYLDLVGVNYYYNNQWVDGGRTVYLGDWLHKPLRELLAMVHARYRRPMFIAETGTEGVFRPAWLHYVCDEAAAARAAGVPLHGICLYPVLDHLGWDDDRYCPNGLFDGVDPAGTRAEYVPLGAELERQQRLFATGGHVTAPLNAHDRRPGAAL